MEYNFNEEFEKMMNENSLDTVILLGHINPDGDAAGAVMGTAHYLRSAYPQYNIIPYLADNLDKGPKKLFNDEGVFSPFDAPQAERYGVIVCDTATRERMTGLEYYENAVASIVIDHHAGNEGFGDSRFVKIAEACCENLFYIFNKECLEKAGAEPYPNAADYLYMGLLHDTGKFSRATPDVLNAGSELLRMGANHRKVILTMQTDTYHDLLQKGKLMTMVQRVMDGKVAYVHLSNETSIREGLGYEDIHPISGNLRDCEDIEMAFTVFEERPGFARCSFRSDGKWINVNELLAPFGGGGHAGAAGLKKEAPDQEKLIADILEAVKKMREEAEKTVK